jgi:hypothetical protein
MIGRKPKTTETMSDEELRAHVLALLGMTDSSKDAQDTVMHHVRSIARKRFTRFAVPALPKAVAKDVQKMRAEGVSPEIVTDFVVHMVPDSDARIHALMQEVATELGTT